jgi:hypothetical protein
MPLLAELVIFYVTCCYEYLAPAPNGAIFDPLAAGPLPGITSYVDAHEAAAGPG